MVSYLQAAASLGGGLLFSGGLPRGFLLPGNHRGGEALEHFLAAFRIHPVKTLPCRICGHQLFGMHNIAEPEPVTIPNFEPLEKPLELPAANGGDIALPPFSQLGEVIDLFVSAVIVFIAFIRLA